MTDLTDPLLGTVSTDQQDYSPGTTATISASGFGVGDNIEFQINVIDPATGAVLWSGPVWDAVEESDANGNGFLTTYFSVTNAYANTTIQLTATDLTTGQVATEVFTDSIEPAKLLAGDGTPTSTAAITVSASTGGSAIFQNIDAAPNDATGTGHIDSFLRLQSPGNSLTEQGFNTNAFNPGVLNDMGGNFTRAITLNDVPTVTVDGVTYREFRLDINQQQDKGSALLTLDSLKIYIAGPGDTGTIATLSDLTNPSNTTLVFDLGHHVTIDTGAGSGHGDIAVLVPDADFANFLGTSHLYLYSEFGNPNGANGGFEEWWVGPTAPPPAPDWALYKDVSVSAPHFADDAGAGTITESNAYPNGPFSGPGDPVDYANQVLTYTVHLVNEGNVSVAGTDLVVTDSYEGGAATTLDTIDPNPGDANGNGRFDPGETWTWTYQHTVQQGEIDSNGGGDGLLSNEVTASAPGGFATTTQSTSDTLIQHPGINIEKLVSVNGGTDWYTVVDSNDNHSDDGGSYHDATLDAIAAATGIANGHLHYGTPLALGPTVQYEAVVTNTGNVDLSGVTVSDPTVSGLSHSFGTLAAGSSAVIDGPVTVNIVAGGQTNTASVSGTYDTSLTVSDSDQAAYSTPSVGAFQGLTKGFWANHQYVWDGDGAANTGNNWWSGTAAPKTNIYGNEGQLYFGANNQNNVISGPNDLNPIKFLLLGDLNHDGLAGDLGGDLKFDFTAAQALLNSSTSADARVILTSQALATQLNDYNIPGEPNGMIEAAVKWLTTSYSAGHLSGGNVDTNGNGVLDISEYSVAKNGSISFTSPSLSSSSNAFQSVATAAGDVGVYTDPNTHVTYEGSGNGLANALNAFNNGQIVLDSTGQYIEWAGTNSWVHNDKGPFWEVAYGHVGGIIHT